MLPRRIGLLRLATHMGHLLGLFAAFAAALYLRFSSGWFVISDRPHLASYAAYVFLAAAFWSLLARYYRVDELLWQGEKLSGWVGAAVRATLSALAAVSLSAFFYRGYSFSRLAVGIFWILHLAVVLSSGVLLVWLRARLGQQQGALRLLVIGRNPFSLRVVARLREGGLLGGQPAFLEPADPGLSACLASGEWDEILLALPLSDQARLAGLLEKLRAAQAPVRVALDLPAGAVSLFGEIPVVDLGSSPGDRLSYAVAKRVLDLAVAFLLLLLGAPLAALVAVLVKLSSPGPVFFAQTRVGANGRSFCMYKFRTFPVQPQEASDRQWSATVPSGATGVGRLLRRLRLDEWPQFWNVLRGEMSVVGPRPERAHFAQGFQQVLREYGLRHRLKAGITGWAQVHGLTGDTDIARRLEYDLYYLRNWSLALDLRIMAMTVLRAFWRGRTGPAQSAGGSPPAPRAGSPEGVSQHAHPL